MRLGLENKLTVLTKRLKKKIKANSTIPYVKCTECEWEGFNPERQYWELVSPCPNCGNLEATYALSYEQWNEIMSTMKG